MSASFISSIIWKYFSNIEYLLILGSNFSSAELKTAFPNFYVSSWSSPSTPIPNNRLHQIESHTSKVENKDASYPISFSQRLRGTHLDSTDEKTSRRKSRSSSLTAFERAKLMMRLRGGSETRAALGKDQHKIDGKGGEKLFGKSGK